MSKEAMKLALEALNVAEHFLEEYAASKYYFAHIVAKTALEEALAKQEQGEPVAWLYFHSRAEGQNPDVQIEEPDCVKSFPDDVVWKKPLYTTPQSKQEQGDPVALKIYCGELCYKSQADDQSFGMWCPVTQDLPFPEGTKFYTTPQQRTWVGLTEEDFVCVHQLCDTPIQAAEYVNHLLKEKNNA